MKMHSIRLKPFLHAYALAIFFAYAVLLLSSWVASIYVDSINALLSPRGIRWMCSSVMDNFSNAPLAVSLMALMAFSVMRKSGICDMSQEHMTMKKKNALRITLAVALVILVLFSLLLFMPNAILLSAFGTISHSAFSHGWPGLLALFVVVVSSVYGYVSGNFSSVGDIIEAHVDLLASSGSVFVCMFLASQFVGAIGYTSVMSSLGDNGSIWTSGLSVVLYYLPLALAMICACRE